MTSGLLLSFTVLTGKGDVPGSKFEREPEQYTVGLLKRWLKCRGCATETCERLFRKSSHTRPAYQQWQMVLCKMKNKRDQIAARNIKMFLDKRIAISE